MSENADTLADLAAFTKCLDALARNYRGALEGMRSTGLHIEGGIDGIVEIHTSDNKVAEVRWESDHYQVTVPW